MRVLLIALLLSGCASKPESPGDVVLDELGITAIRISQCKPKPAREPIIVNPEMPKLGNVTGMINVHLTINAEGQAENIRIASSKRHTMKLKKAVKNWRFVPARDENMEKISVKCEFPWDISWM